MATDNRNVTGAARLSRRIKTIRAGIALPVLTNEIGELLLRRTKDRFARGVDADGVAWAGLSANTLRAKARMGVSGKGTLRRTDALYNAIRVIRGDVTGSIFTNTGAGVRIGVAGDEEAIVGRFHQRGTKHMPSRQFLGVGDLDVKSVDSFLRRRIQKVVDLS